MTKRSISIADKQGRDAQIEVEAPKRAKRHTFVNATGVAVNSDRFIKSTETQSYDALLGELGSPEAVGQALIDGDPEIDMKSVGRRVGEADRVWIREDGSVLYCARTLLVQYDPEGNEVKREDMVDVEASVSVDEPLVWSQRLFPVEEVVRRFALVRKLRLRHVNGLTFDFLHEMAKTLHDSGKMLFVGAGAKGRRPLIFQTNGSPYRGFLEGRVDGDGYMLVLHLSNLELKSLTTATAEEKAS